MLKRWTTDTVQTVRLMHLSLFISHVFFWWKSESIWIPSWERCVCVCVVRLYPGCNASLVLQYEGTSIFWEVGGNWVIWCRLELHVWIDPWTLELWGGRVTYCTILDCTFTFTALFFSIVSFIGLQSTYLSTFRQLTYTFRKISSTWRTFRWWWGLANMGRIRKIKQTRM